MKRILRSVSCRRKSHSRKYWRPVRVFSGRCYEGPISVTEAANEGGYYGRE